MLQTAVPLESIMMLFFTLSVSSSLEKCPGPDPRSTTVSNFRFISYQEEEKQVRTYDSIKEPSNHHKSLHHPLCNLFTNVVYGSISRPGISNGCTIFLQPFRVPVKDLIWTNIIYRLWRGSGGNSCKWTCLGRAKFVKKTLKRHLLSLFSHDFCDNPSDVSSQPTPSTGLFRRAFSLLCQLLMVDRSNSPLLITTEEAQTQLAQIEAMKAYLHQCEAKIDQGRQNYEAFMQQLEDRVHAGDEAK